MNHSHDRLSDYTMSYDVDIDIAMTRIRSTADSSSSEVLGRQSKAIDRDISRPPKLLIQKNKRGDLTVQVRW